MITSLVKVALLSMTACGNAVLSAKAPIKNKYITNDTPQFDTYKQIINDDVNFQYDRLLEEGSGSDLEFVATQFSTAIYTATYNNIETKTIFVSAYTHKQTNNTYFGELIDTPDRKPFFLTITRFRINTNANIVVDIDDVGAKNWAGADLYLQDGANRAVPITMTEQVYSSFNNNFDEYIQTLSDYFNKNPNSLVADDPYTYRSKILQEMNVNGTINTYNTNNYNGWAEGNIATCYGIDIEEAITLFPNQNLYIVNDCSFERTRKDYEAYINDAPYTDIFDWEYEYDLEIYEWRERGWLYTPTTYEVINIPDIMFTIVSMPFTFISRAFNLTLFPNTPYAVNIGNIFLSIIAILTFIFVLKILLKLKG